MVRSTMLVVLFIQMVGIVNANAAYRNVALNKSDVHDSKWKPDNGYPHASSNSEYNLPNDSAYVRYMAKNVINGDTANWQHWEYDQGFSSWGPQMNVQNLYLKIDFGKTFEVDKLVIWIRADWNHADPIPHDSYWKKATVVYSDNTKDTINIDSTRVGQTRIITKKATSSVTFTNLVPSNPNNWCGFTEIQVWGDDPQSGVKPTGGSTKKVKKTSNFQVILPDKRLTAEPDVHGFEFFTPSGRFVGAWHRSRQEGSVDVDLPKTMSKTVILTRVSYEKT
jgi:hypothetical protein